MTEESDRLEIKRILVALDMSPHSLAAMRAAVELAAEWGADLVGLFVEDLDLLRLAQLPFAREVAVYSARVRSLGEEQVELQLRAQAARLRRDLARLAMRQGVRWNFEIARGVIARELLSEAEEADLVVLGKTGWSESQSLGSTTRVVVAQARGRVLILQHQARMVPSLRVVYDGSPQGERALASAAMLAGQGRREISILLVADSEERVSELRKGAAQLLRQQGLSARYRALIDPDPDELVEASEALDCVLVLPVESERLPEDMLLDILDQLECPVLLVR